MNTPGGNTISTAEHTIALMLALSRNIAPAYQSLRRGPLGPQEVHGHAVGRQDAGHRRPRAGSARRSPPGPSALEMKVLGYDPFLSAARAKELGIETCASAQEMFPLVDYLTVHTPLTDETRNLIGAEEIKLMKKGVRLINCARGGIYDEAALVEGAQERPGGRRGAGRLRRGALHQQPAVRHARRALHAAPGRQHRGGPDERGRRGGRAADRLLHHRRDPPGGQHVAAGRRRRSTSLRGYLNVAYRLGPAAGPGRHAARRTAAGCVYRARWRRRTRGCSRRPLPPGLLEHAMDEDVNIVNAEVLLRRARHRTGRGADQRHRRASAR